MWLRLVPLGIWLCLPFGCDGFPGGRKAARVGVILPLSSDSGVGANLSRRALDLAIEGSRDRIQFIYRDDQGQPARTAEAVHELVTEQDVIAIIGGLTSPCALAAAERAERLGVPFITPMATNANIARDREWAFQLCFTDPQQGARMARFAWGPLSLKSVCVIRDIRNDYSVGLADAFAATFLEQGGDVVAELSYRSEWDSSEHLVEWFERSRADALYLPLYSPDIIDVLGKLAGEFSGREVTFLGGDAWHSSAVREYLRDRPVPQKIFITSHFASDRDDEEVQRFLKLLRPGGESGGQPMPTAAEALGYDAARLMLKALESGPDSRAAARDAIRQALSDFQGAAGNCSVDPGTGEPRKDVPVLEWREDHWRLFAEEPNR